MERVIAGLINIDSEIMGGTPVFLGTRVPVQSLFDHLQAGIPLSEFLDDFPSVSEEQAVQMLDRLGQMLNDPSKPLLNAFAA